MSFNNPFYFKCGDIEPIELYNFIVDVLSAVPEIRIIEGPLSYSYIMLSIYKTQNKNYFDFFGVDSDKCTAFWNDYRFYGENAVEITFENAREFISSCTSPNKQHIKGYVPDILNPAIDTSKHIRDWHK